MKIIRNVLIAILLIVIVGVGLIYCLNREDIEQFLSRDGCLDAGGRWNAATEKCEFAE